MKKAIKIIIALILAVVALVVLAVLTLPLWLGPVVKPLANAAVPQVTKTEFNLGHLALNPYTGRFEIGDLLLGNPAGYSEPKALELKRLIVDVATDSLATEVVHVEEVTVDGLFASYVSKDGVNNFDQIQYNAAGGKEKYEAKKAKAKAEAEQAEIKAEAEKKAKGDDKGSVSTQEEETKAPRVVIDKLVIKDIKLKYEMLTLPVPSITLTDLGKKSEGLTMSELCDTIMQAILKAATAVGDGAKLLGGLIGDGAKSVGDTASKAVDAVNATAAGKAVSETTGKAVDAVGEGAKKAAGAVGEGAKAVGEGAKKAADALKNLF